MPGYITPPEYGGGEAAYTVVETHRRWVTLKHRQSGLLYLIGPDGQKHGTAQTLPAIHILRARTRRRLAQQNPS